jgi:protein-tyrosine phosphatase
MSGPRPPGGGKRERAAVPLTGALNFRDLGGLPTADGHQTRADRLFRSDTLQALTAEDASHLVQSLGVTLVMDLRDAGEAVEQGRGLLADSPVCYVNIPLEAAPAADGRAGPHAGSATLDFYLGHLRSQSPGLSLAIQILAVSLTRPVVVHCAAGKDRTGLVIALALGIAGVRTEAIIDDYMATAQNMPRINERFRSWPRYREHMQVADPELYRVQEHSIRTFLSELDERHGGARGWARRRGVPDPVLDMLAGRLVED